MIKSKLYLSRIAVKDKKNLLQFNAIYKKIYFENRFFLMGKQNKPVLKEKKNYGATIADLPFY